MTPKNLTSRQLFTMQNRSLAKKVEQFFEATNDAGLVMQYAVALLVREALCISDFSDIFKNLVRQILLTSEPNDIMRQFSAYFQDYFDKLEWKTVLHRLYKNEAEYHEVTKQTRRYKALLDKKHREVVEASDYQFDIVSVFKDANGKKHKWTLRNTKRVHSEEEIAEVLQILTTLTIFQTPAGVRRFVEYDNYESVKSCIDASHKMENEHEPLLTKDEDTLCLSQEKVLSTTEGIEKRNQSGNLPLESVSLNGRASRDSHMENHQTQKDPIIAETSVLESLDDSSAPVSKKQLLSKNEQPKPTNTPNKVDFRKPKSKEQQEREYKEGLLSRVKRGSGKRGSGNKKKKNGKRK